MMLSIIFLFASQSRVDAFMRPSVRYHVGVLRLAREYVVIGGNLPGVNPDDEDDTYNMSKQERRRREREKGDADFQNGEYKKKKKKFTINYDKLEEKVTKQRTLLPREQREVTKSNFGIPEKVSKKNAVDKKLTLKATKLQKQRTAGGTVHSTGETILPQSPDTQAVQIRVAKRGIKIVTMVQGMCDKHWFVLYHFTILIDN